MSKCPIVRTIFLVSAVLSFDDRSVVGDWASFRDGGQSQSAGELPVEWSPSSRITWQCELPGYGQSTPVIMGDRVFVTAVEGLMKEKCLVLCLELSTGRELWRAEVQAANPSPSSFMASRAAPTPTVDQAAVYAFFETGDVVAINHDGQQLWHRELTADYGKFDNNHGLGSSPAQNASLLFLNIEHRGPSYLVALDKHSGETKWKVERGSTSSWASPILCAVDGREQVIVSSAGNVTAYDAQAGQVAWSVEGLDGNSVPSPTLIGQQLYVGARLPEFAEDGSIRSNCCIDLSKMIDGKPQVTWRADKAISDYSSPVVCGGCAYFLNKVGVLYCLDSVTGKVHYAKRLGTQCWSTPIVTQQLIYFFGKDGKTQVVKAGPEFEVIASNALWPDEAPPKPESYVEHAGGGHGHGANSNETPGDKPREDQRIEDATSEGRPSEGRPSGAPGGGMLAGLMKGDANGDGVLTADEISTDFKPMVPRIDTNGDGSLDQAEVAAMVESFAVRRADSQASARDPIVYGAAASNGKIAIRTGTRLYVIE